MIWAIESVRSTCAAGSAAGTAGRRFFPKSSLSSSLLYSLSVSFTNMLNQSKHHDSKICFQLHSPPASPRAPVTPTQKKCEWPSLTDTGEDIMITSIIFCLFEKQCGKMSSVAAQMILQVP